MTDRPWCYNDWIAEIAMEEKAVAGLTDGTRIKLPVGDAALETVRDIKARTEEKRALVAKYK